MRAPSLIQFDWGMITDYLWLSVYGWSLNFILSLQRETVNYAMLRCVNFTIIIIQFWVFIGPLLTEWDYFPVL